MGDGERSGDREVEVRWGRLRGCDEGLMLQE